MDSNRVLLEAWGDRQKPGNLQRALRSPEGSDTRGETDRDKQHFLANGARQKDRADGHEIFQNH